MVTFFAHARYAGLLVTSEETKLAIANAST